LGPLQKEISILSITIKAKIDYLHQLGINDHDAEKVANDTFNPFRNIVHHASPKTIKKEKPAISISLSITAKNYAKICKL
jgi:hypothetical protein